MKKNQLLKNIAMSLVAIIVCLALLEISLRIVFPKRQIEQIEPYIFMKSSNNVLFYEMRPNASMIRYGVNITINSKGMRDMEYDFEKKKGTYRIAVLGDSVVASVDLNISDVFTEILERKLNSYSKDKKFEVLNFGVNGYGTVQELVVLREKALKFKPDVVIVGYVLNDPLPISEGVKNFFTNNEERKKDICRIHFANIKVPCALREFIDNLRITEFFYSSISNIKNTLGDDFYTILYKDSSKWNRTIEAFRKMKILANKSNTKIVLVIFPLMHNLKEYRWEKVHDAIRGNATENGFYVVDILDEYKKYKDNELKLAGWDIIHPNKKGQEIAAEYVYERLVEAEIINLNDKSKPNR